MDALGAMVRYRNHDYRAILNVGKAKNDGEYHIYDLTRPAKAQGAAGHDSGLSGPSLQGNRIASDSFNTTVTQDHDGVKTIVSNDAVDNTTDEAWLREETERVLNGEKETEQATEQTEQKPVKKVDPKKPANTTARRHYVCESIKYN